MTISITNLNPSLGGVVNVGQEISQAALDAIAASSNPSTSNPVITNSALGAQLANKSNVGHTHVVSDVTNLQSALDGKAATSHTHVISDVTALQSALDSKANLASPALTGVPTAPTASSNTNTTQIASTQFVQTAISNITLPGGGGSAADIQVFGSPTTSGTFTWNKPLGAKFVYAYIVGSGGLGGAGVSGSISAIRRGGGSGAAGGVTDAFFLADELPSSVSVRVGVSNSSLGTSTLRISSFNGVKAMGGDSGGSGGAGSSGGSNSAAGFSSGGTAAISNAAGVSSPTFSGAPNPNGLGYSWGGRLPTSGGAGCTMFANENSIRTGGSGGSSGSNLSEPAIAGGSGSSAGNGVDAPNSFRTGTGGGGGGYNNGLATNGGNGGWPGGSGGGGGPATSPNPAGLGGTGGNGRVVVVTYF